MSKVITVYTDDGDEVELSLPTYREVCSRCQGTGTHCNPSIDGNGIARKSLTRTLSSKRATSLGHTMSLATTAVARM